MSSYGPNVAAAAARRKSIGNLNETKKNDFSIYFISYFFSPLKGRWLGLLAVRILT